MSILANTLWLLCGLSAVVLAALTGRAWMGRAGMAIGFALALVAIPAWVSLQIEWTGVLAALGATILLVWPRYAAVAAMAGGGLAAILGLLITQQGLPGVAVYPACALLLMIPVLLASKETAFAAEVVRDEALLGILAVGLMVALTPGLQDGWRSAMALNTGGADLDSGQSIPVWALWITGASAALGGAHYVWRRQ